jgi:adenylate cyclase
VELEPSLADTHISLGHVFTAEEKYDDAARELRLAMSINPRSSEAYYRLGHLRVREAKLDEAAELFEQAATLEPADFRPSLQLAWIYRTLGKDARSREAEARTGALRAMRTR